MRSIGLLVFLFFLNVCCCAAGNEKSSKPIYGEETSNNAVNRYSALSFQCIGESKDECEQRQSSSSGQSRSSLGKLTTWQTVDIHKRLSEIERRIGDLEDQIEQDKSNKS